ncbi:hypothetical protein BBJ28_00010173 [Nothophytophthora sp. Chile5]|nr:hypothetical protein BBJ28_00010173 [Nothophytophthora sp. Chile5]
MHAHRNCILRLTTCSLLAVVLVGDPGVGKTNLLATFLASEPGSPESPAATTERGVSRTFSAVRKPTIGVEFGTAIVRHPNGKRIKAQIWDTGKPRTNPRPLSWVNRPLVVYDVSSRASFDNAQEHWLKELKASADLSSTLPSCIMLVGNKVDLMSPEVLQDPSFVSQELHDSAATSLGLLHQRASAKTCVNVRRAFEELVVAIYNADKDKLQRLDTIRAIHLEERSPQSSQPSSRRKPTASGCCEA